MVTIANMQSVGPTEHGDQCETLKHIYCLNILRIDDYRKKA